MPSQKFILFRYAIALLLLLVFSASVAQMQKLRVGDNHRFLVKEDGSPFVWIGETNWFFAKLPPATIDSILDKRSAQGFTMMMVSCREELYNGEGTGGINTPNEAWWRYLDAYIAKCAQRNMYVGITLGWWGKTRNNSADDLYEYGRWVGDRYKNNNNIVWLTLGEAGGHLRKNSIPDEKLNALVRGIREGDTGDKLLTVHADFKRSTSISNDAQLCDFNNWQTSQWCCLNDLPRKDERTWTVWEAIAFDYGQRYDGQPKPTLDSEAWYENNKDFCGTTPFNIRRRAYFTIFAGAFGHSYGAGGIWDGLTAADSCSSSALKAIHYPGARDIGYVSNFLHKLGDDFLKLRPDQSIIPEGNSDNYDTHIQATKASDNSFALVYSASDAAYSVDVSALLKSSLTAVWYNPRSNQYQTQSDFKLAENKSTYTFDPPGNSGAGNDWVLVLGEQKFTSRFTAN
ncbi:apiosidase-like domain-containing protein [Tunicatimonas pelagia]|uniref:apiosidase-like domain-containing protein n=1 Tax=Tunicatimonas pelagia TaxID=931531 RepID=UPI002665ABF6|nr:DUF4038 domain-containing protein [Tunicatimonas pelagia]WKN40676.1 DUF4038 domain-containing protein [Tunicatimonas pelagia]